MSRRPNLVPTKTLNLALPRPVFDLMEELLFSPLEMRVPHGEYSRWMSQRIRDYFQEVPLDLAVFYPECPAGTLIVRGSPEAMETLLLLLRKLP